MVKYKHRFCNTEFGDLKLTRQQLAIVCVLLLRGPQTPGELRTRTNRLAEFANVDEVEAVMDGLQEHNGEQLVTKLEREPGKRESRYAHLFSDVPVVSAAPIASAPEQAASGAEERLSTLEQEVAELKLQVAKLSAVIEDLME